MAGEAYYSEHGGTVIDIAVSLVEKKKRNIENLPENTMKELDARIPSSVMTQAEYDELESPKDILYMILEDE